jgi:hypothetical protein
MSRYRCHICAATFTAWAPAERHADAEHHHRIEVLAIDHRTEGGAMPKKKELKDRRHGEKRMGAPPPSLKATQTTDPTPPDKRRKQ